jgi:hypothetical protein
MEYVIFYTPSGGAIYAPVSMGVHIGAKIIDFCNSISQANAICDVINSKNKSEAQK